MVTEASKDDLVSHVSLDVSHSDCSWFTNCRSHFASTCCMKFWVYQKKEFPVLHRRHCNTGKRIDPKWEMYILFWLKIPGWSNRFLDKGFIWLQAFFWGELYYLMINSLKLSGACHDLFQTCPAWKFLPRFECLSGDWTSVPDGHWTLGSTSLNR